MKTLTLVYYENAYINTMKKCGFHNQSCWLWCTV